MFTTRYHRALHLALDTEETDFLDSANLVQHVSGPTHRRGHTLDLIITRKDESLIKEVQVLNDIYSYHCTVQVYFGFSLHSLFGN